MKIYDMKKLLKKAIMFNKDSISNIDGLWFADGIALVADHHDMYWEEIDDISSNKPVSLSYKQILEINSLYSLLDNSLDVKISIGETIQLNEHQQIKQITITVGDDDNYTFRYNGEVDRGKVQILIDTFIHGDSKTEVVDSNMAMLHVNPKSIRKAINMLDTDKGIYSDGILIKQYKYQTCDKLSYRPFIMLYTNDEKNKKYFISMLMSKRGC